MTGAAAAQAVRPAPAARPAEPVRREAAVTRAASPPRYLMSRLVVGGLDDPEEHQAEQASARIAEGGVAHAVMDPGAQHQYSPTERLRRCGAGCGCDKCKGVSDPGGAPTGGYMRRLLANSAPAPASSRTEAVVRAAESLPGRPMQSPMRTRLERGF